MERMAEKKNEWGLERKNQNVSSNYLRMVEFGGGLILIFLTDRFFCLTYFSKMCVFIQYFFFF